MPYSASVGAAETEDGAVERMRMVLFSFTNAYYTKKLPRNLPRSSTQTAAECAGHSHLL